MPDATKPRTRRTRANPKMVDGNTEPPKTTPPADEKINTPPPEAAPKMERLAQGVRQTPLEKKLERMVAAMGLPFAAAGDMHCARHFATKAPIVAEGWANLAAESPAVKEVLENMMKGSAWTGAIGVTAGLLIPVAAHHGAPLPPMAARLFGAEVPEKQATEPVPKEEPIVQPTGFVNGNGHSEPRNVPGPAAFSAPATGGGSPTLGGDPTDPGAYPGPA